MEEKQKDRPGRTEESKEKGFTPASFEKRVAAWVGVVYVVMLLLAATFTLATGRMLTATAPILLPPAAVGTAVVAVYRWRRGQISEGRNFTLALLFLCFMALVVGLVCGVPPLLAHLGIATPLIPNP